MANGNLHDDRAATLGDINGIYTVLNPMREMLATINQNLKDRPRPCPDFIGLKEKVDLHLNNHSEVTKTFRDKAIGVVMDLGKMAAVGLFAYWVARGNM
jgi:hypothetical protein